MLHKSGVAIITIYQAPSAETSLEDVQCKVYDEAQALDAAKSGVMTEIAATGRYKHTWTPDAAGVWSVQCWSTAQGGQVVATYDVKAADEFGIKAAVDALNDLATSDLDTALGTYDGPTKSEMDTAHGLLTTPAEVATALTTYDAPTKAEMDVLGTAALATETKQDIIDTNVDDIETILGTPANFMADVSAVALEATVATVDGIVDDILVDTAAIDTAVGATGGIRGADGDDLKDISDQIDSIASPAMVG